MKKWFICIWNVFKGEKPRKPGRILGWYRTVLNFCQRFFCVGGGITPTTPDVSPESRRPTWRESRWPPSPGPSLSPPHRRRTLKQQQNKMWLWRKYTLFPLVLILRFYYLSFFKIKSLKGRTSTFCKLFPNAAQTAEKIEKRILMCLTNRIQFLHPSQGSSLKKRSKHSMSTKRQPYCTNHIDRKFIHKARMLRIANIKRDVTNQYGTWTKWGRKGFDNK